MNRVITKPPRKDVLASLFWRVWFYGLCVILTYFKIFEFFYLIKTSINCCMKNLFLRMEMSCSFVIILKEVINYEIKLLLQYKLNSNKISIFIKAIFLFNENNITLSLWNNNAFHWIQFNLLLKIYIITLNRKKIL